MYLKGDWRLRAINRVVDILVISDVKFHVSNDQIWPRTDIFFVWIVCYVVDLLKSWQKHIHSYHAVGHGHRHRPLPMFGMWSLWRIVPFWPTRMVLPNDQLCCFSFEQPSLNYSMEWPAHNNLQIDQVPVICPNDHLTFFDRVNCSHHSTEWPGPSHSSQ